MPLRRLTALVVCAFVFAFLSEPSVASAIGPGSPVRSAVDLDSARQHILSKTNAARVAAGLAPLSVDPALNAVSQSCSQTQASANTMGHCAGFQNKYPPGWTWFAENVAVGYSYESVVDGWLNSPGHRANILRPDATHVGIGYELSATGRPYYTQNFASYPASVRAPSGPRYYRTAYDGSIWRVEGSDIRALSWQEWGDVGFPAWQPAPTDYVKYPWSSSISAVTFFGGDASRWVWKHLDYASWSAAGRPAPRAAGWIDGSSIHQWATGSELFLRDVGGVVHKLNYRQWQDTGFRGFERRANQGYVRLSWDSSGTIAFMCDISAGQGSRVDFSAWSGAGYPSPQATQRTARDLVWKEDGAATIHYSGAVIDTALSFSQWSAMGFPSPSNALGASVQPHTCS